MSRHEIDKQRGLLGMFRLLIVTPSDIKELYEVYISPLWQSWRKPNYAEFDSDEEFDRAYDAVEAYRENFRRTFSRALWDKHCTRYVVQMFLFPLISIWLSWQWIANIFSGHANWFLQLILIVAACALFMLARNAWHNVAKCIAIADAAAIDAYNEVLDLEEVERLVDADVDTSMFI